MRFGPVWPLQTPTPTPTEAATEVATEVATDIGGLLPFSIPVWVANIGRSLIVIGLAIVVSRLLVRLLGRRVARQFRRPSLTRTVLRGIRVSVYVFALLTILNIYGLQLGDIALSVTVFTAVVGVVLAPILGSYISGVFLLADQPYEIGDMIELADTGQQGFVEDITLRHTKVFTLDNTFLVIPNGEIRQRDVVNYSAEDSRTRLSLDVLVTYESDIAVARTLIEAAAREVDNVISGGPDIRVGAARYPASPTVYINNFADHGVLLTLRYWVTEPYKLLAVRSKVQTNVWQRLEDADVEIAYPHSHLYFDDTSGEMNVSLNNGFDAINGIDRTRTATGDSPVPPHQDPDDLADE
ncbi:mechanosensitive ion channel protein MscS [Haloarcula taiwanensis]|uniref:Mechanosensitive ion channel protein MscS n=1 Tax=Haloarcula taiwanensis TaxID=1932004 RepID=A0A2H4ZWS2_9EURY|nr:mechanosensitive ion channel family protein [Haloarcula taiwanensis]AUG46913.1 mechanosensitive ion channel protein MscS [Haloarcula taiwanensis]